MRILVDEEKVGWDDAWEITVRSCGYTNHTVLPEALETWPERLFAYLLPRHLQIIQEIDRRFLIQVKERFPDRHWKNDKIFIITGQGERQVQMARLAIVGSHTVNGVSELHSDILKKNLFNDFYVISPEKFRNITNGITPRRWLMQANPGLSMLINEAIGDGWKKDAEELKKLEPMAEDSAFRQRFSEIKKQNKNSLSGYLYKTNGLFLPPDFLLDCQVKRLHEYKRQLLNILHIITLYNRIIEGRTDEFFVPRTVLFAGKSAPGYFICKLIIKLIHNIAVVVNADPVVREKLQVVFVPNYGVTIAQKIMPAAELSEQISTAGYEASGTGNMKFMLNGALTIGTLDGANVEIREEVGEENFFLFGLKTEEIIKMRSSYDPLKYYKKNKELKQAVDQISAGYFSEGDSSLFQPIVSILMKNDHFFVLADYDSYIKCQEKVNMAYKDKEYWNKMAILNVARSGKFSSDRAIREYAEKIWNIKPVP